MTERNVPDISHLRGAELERVARSLSAGTLEVILGDKEALIALKTDDLKKLSEILAMAHVPNCGGFGCG